MISSVIYDHSLWVIFLLPFTAYLCELIIYGYTAENVFACLVVPHQHLQFAVFALHKTFDSLNIL